jgi:hypothetical protein
LDLFLSQTAIIVLRESVMIIRFYLPLLVQIKVLELLVVVHIHLIWLGLSNMVVFGDWDW